jgi:thioredoxin-like negative regulator of GroEL
MSKINVEYNLEKILAYDSNVFVLFYATWCPFSQRFLPVFEKFAQDKTRKYASVVIDDKANLCEKYSVEIVPTVLLLSKGKVKERLGGIQGAGLTEKQLANFASTH